MADVLEKIRKLIRLAQSDNSNESRNSAHTAARLIHEHKVVLSLPGHPPVDATVRVDPGSIYDPAPRQASRPPRKARDLYGMTWMFHEDGPTFGGHCLFCALPMMRFHAAYVGDGGMLHVACWNERQTGKSRPGPAPAPAQKPVIVDTPQTRAEEAAAIDDLWSKFDAGRK
jgi:hypothetical protein